VETDERTAAAEILMNYRLAYLSETMVNWCPKLGTVLANDEVKEGFSVRGGHPVERKKMKQWLLRITAYAQRLLDGLGHYRLVRFYQRNPEKLDWKIRRCNHIFPVKDHDLSLEVFTTRPDTILRVYFYGYCSLNMNGSISSPQEYASKVKAYVDG
jgi:leucyl-tRNA synthetase